MCGRGGRATSSTGTGEPGRTWNVPASIPARSRTWEDRRRRCGCGSSTTDANALVHLVRIGTTGATPGTGGGRGRAPRPGATPPRTALEKAGEAVYDPELERLSAARLVTVDSLAPFPQLPFVRGHRVGPNELWAIDATGIFLGRFDGKRWTVGSTRSPLLADVNGLWFASETDGWAIAGPTILRWDGREWTLAARVSPVLERAGRDATPRQPDRIRELRFHALWGSASDDVWAVGEAGVTMHWDGQSWTYVRRNDWPDLTVLAGRGRNDVWTGGCIGDAVVVLHWDGWNWRRWDAPSYQALDSPGTPCPVPASMGDGAGARARRRSALAIDAAGSWSRRFPHPRVASTRGSPRRKDARRSWPPVWRKPGRWAAETTDQPYEPSPFAVHLSCAGSAAEDLAPLPGQGSDPGGARHAGPDDVWAVGTDGLVLHFDGEFWTRLPIDASQNLVALHGAGRTVWITAADASAPQVLNLPSSRVRRRTASQRCDSIRTVTRGGCAGSLVQSAAPAARRLHERTRWRSTSRVHRRAHGFATQLSSRRSSSTSSAS